MVRREEVNARVGQGGIGGARRYDMVDRAGVREELGPKGGGG